MRSRARLGHLEYLIIILIFAVIVGVDLQLGIIVGTETVDELHVKADLDRAVQWCEGRLIAERAATAGWAAGVRPLRDLLIDILASPAAADQVAPFLERQEVRAGETLVVEGASSDDIYFFESGEASVEVCSEAGAMLHLAKLGPGSIVGEMAFYLGEPRSASIIVERDAVVWRLGRQALDRMQRDAPVVAAEFHAGLAAVLARRLAATNRLIRFLVD